MFADHLNIVVKESNYTKTFGLSFKYRVDEKIMEIV